MWGMVVTSTFDLLWPYPTLQHTGPRIVCNVGGRLFSHRNRREKFVFRRQSERAQAEFVGRFALGETTPIGVMALLHTICLNSVPVYVTILIKPHGDRHTIGRDRWNSIGSSSTETESTITESNVYVRFSI